MSGINDLKVSALVEISKALSSSLDIEKVLNNILKVVSNSLGMQRGTITLIDPKTEELKIEVAHGLTAEEKERGRYKIGEGITGKVVESGEPLAVPNVGKSPLFLNKTKSRKNLRRENIAFLCVPIKVGDNVIGALSADQLFSEKEHSFEEEINFLTIISAMIGQSVKIREMAEAARQAVVLENVKLKRELKSRYKFENIIYASPKMEAVLESAMQVADSKANVLVRGDSGTGKELVAKAIHFASERSSMPFVKVACAALPENLLEAELFGYERGAFTGAMERKKGRFEVAEGGTLFLDEIGDFSASTQVKLLRILQDREFERLGSTDTLKADVRIIAATHRNLEKMVKERRFREDLFYRINVFPITLPPLRERKEDIPLLSAHFIEKYSREYKKHVKGISKGALDLLMGNDFPGNVRELENLIERAVVVAKKAFISTDDLGFTSGDNNEMVPSEVTLEQAVESFEKQRIEEALNKFKRIQSKAARYLGISARQIGYKIDKYKIKI